MKNVSKLVVVIVVLLSIMITSISVYAQAQHSSVVTTANVVVLSADVKINTTLYTQLKDKDLDDALYTDKYACYTVYIKVVGNKAKYYVRRAIDSYDPMTGIAIIDGLESEKCTLEPGTTDTKHLYWTNVATGVQHMPAVEPTK